MTDTGVFPRPHSACLILASALAGDDVEKMQKMQEAMQKGFKQATAAWGKSLPSISQQTMDAANKLFDDYYKSKGVEA